MYVELTSYDLIFLSSSIFLLLCLLLLLFKCPLAVFDYIAFIYFWFFLLVGFFKKIIYFIVFVVWKFRNKYLYSPIYWILLLHLLTLSLLTTLESILNVHEAYFKALQYFLNVLYMKLTSKIFLWIEKIFGFLIWKSFKQKKSALLPYTFLLRSSRR